MKKYQSYKDSRIDWKTEFPSHWTRTTLRYVGRLYRGLTGRKGDDFNNDENKNNKFFIPFTNIFNNTYISKDHFQLVNVEPNEKQNEVRKFDLLFLMSSEFYKNLGKSSILLEDIEELYLNSFCKGFRITDESVYPLFLNYQLLGNLHRGKIGSEGNGFTRINLRQDSLLGTPLFIPPLSEQKQIVEYLDSKTEKIDNLIKYKEEKIQLLKEKRTSLIDHVVTKGLDEEVELKDSGVEWIGKIPNHWRITKIKYTTDGSKESFIDGDWIESKNITENGIRYITTGNIGEGNYKEQGNGYISEETFRQLSCTEVLVGDLVISRLSLPVGRSCIIPDLKNRIVTSVDNVILRPNEGYNKYFLNYLFNSSKYYEFTELTSRGTTLTRISRTMLGNNCVIVPPLSEQKQIVEYLDSKTEKIDNLVSMEQKKIELLKEYKQSIISEVVTGKLRVCKEDNSTLVETI